MFTPNVGTGLYLCFRIWNALTIVTGVQEKRKTLRIILAKQGQTLRREDRTSTLCFGT